MKNKVLLFATIVAMSTLNAGIVKAADVTNWEGLGTAGDITIKNDISASGDTKIINLSPGSGQTIDGGGYSITGADGYYFKSVGTGDVIMKNLGKYSDGSAQSNTFSYVDMNGDTLYKTIDASVNSFKRFVYKESNTQDVASFNISNSVFANNVGTLFRFNQPKSALSIKDSIIYNNSAASEPSIINSNSIEMNELSLKNVIMANNSGQYNINVAAQNIVVEDSTFYKNTDTSDGGVMSGTGTIKVKNSYFGENESSGDGGALLIKGGTGITIEGSKFEDNYAGGDGGAIYFYSNAQVDSIKNTQFINNHNGAYDGGAISTGGALIKNIDNVVFENNKTYRLGGGMWYGMAAGYEDSGSVLINNTVFKNNEAGVGGGLVFGGGIANTKYIVNSKFTDNTATADNHLVALDFDWGQPEGPLGGGVYTEWIPTTYINTSFENNKAVPDDNGDSSGGAIFFVGDSDDFPFSIVDSTFSDNSAGTGGAIYVRDNNLSIIASAKDVIFSGNTASKNSDTFNAGSDIYFDTTTNSAELATLYLNASEGKKVVFNGSIGVAEGENNAAIDINKSGVTYNTYDGTTETAVNAGTGGEIQFNGRVGDANNYFSSINLYGGTLSIGQNSTATNPDGLINDNNFYVKGNSTLNTANGVIGEFAPNAFEIISGATLDYQFDIDLAGGVSDKLVITNNEGTLRLSILNVINDTDADGLRIKYSDNNINGILHDDYEITTSHDTYDVTAENGNDGSFVVFTATHTGGGLPSAIIAESDQYIITNGQDENVVAWGSNTGNVITHDIDINGNGQSIYTENNLDGMVANQGTNVVLRNIKELSGFNNALTNNGGTLSIIDSNVVNNTGVADITNNSGSVIIEAASKEITIGSDNTANALLSDGGTVNITGSNKVTFNGNVTGTNDASMNISTDTTFNGDVSGINIAQQSGTVDIGNFSGADYTLDDGTLNLGESGIFAPDTFELNQGTVHIADESLFSPQVNVFNGGNLNAINGSVGSLNFNSLTLENIINLAVDIDLNREIMDRISASSVSGDGIIKVNQFNVLSDTEKSSISIPFASDNLKDRVSTDIQSIEGKIYKYNINYDNKTGQFNIVGGGNKSDGYSPSVMASPVAAQLQGYLTQLNSYDEAFRNMDMYMLMPKSVRQAMKYKNRVAVNSSDFSYDGSKSIYDDNTGWVRTHTTFENVPLKNGPKVSNVAYGIYFGGESQLYDLGKGWEGIWGLYAGYNGSHQSYNGISMYQNGGTLGILGMAYKGNFFQGLTINTGANGGEASTRYGNEDFSMLMAGIASKTGYNIEFKQGRYIVQPSLLLSYSFVNSFDYTNAAGIHISSDPLHAIQVEPNIKFIANLKNGWQPYASVGMVWNLMDKTHYHANDVSLPELSVKPYVKYGVGVRKSWGERFTGFIQTFITNGGRNGVGMQVGFRWALGGKKSVSKANK